MADKKNLPTIDMDQYVQNVTGINLMLRGKMMKAFESDNAKGELHDLIWDSNENMIRPEIREILKGYWHQNF